MIRTVNVSHLMCMQSALDGFKPAQTWACRRRHSIFTINAEMRKSSESCMQDLDGIAGGNGSSNVLLQSDSRRDSALDGDKVDYPVATKLNESVR